MIKILVLLVLLAATSLAAGRKAELIKLTTGAPVYAMVVTGECTNDVLVMRDFRSKKKLTVPWSKVDPEHAHRLRVELGFEVEASADTLRIKGHQLKNRVGNTFIGLLLNAATAEKEGVFQLKTSGGILKIKVADVRSGPFEIEVNALTVYTGAELYEQRLESEPPADAVGHFRIAEFAVQIGVLEKAKEHYEKVLSFEDSKYAKDTIQRQIDRVDKLLGQAVALSALKEIKQRIVFNKFDDAAALIEAFRAKYEDEGLLSEAKNLEEQSAERRTEYYIMQVTRELPSSVKYLLVQKLKEKELTLKDAQRYAAGEPSAEASASAHAVTRTAERLEIPEPDVLKFWDLRNEARKRPMQRAFYRDGTFMILEDLPDPLTRAPKIKRPKGKRGQAGPRPPKPRPRLKPETWWARNRSKTNILRDFLFAYWVENANMCVVLDPKKQTCTNCSGKGYLSRLHTTSQGAVQYFDRCGVCNDALHFRVVQWR